MWPSSLLYMPSFPLSCILLDMITSSSMLTSLDYRNNICPVVAFPILSCVSRLFNTGLVIDLG